MWQRLQKVIAAAGVASRRHAEELIAQGRVKVNGEIIREMGTMVDPETQEILVNGQRLEITVEKRYIALHKPVGYVSTVSDPYAEKKVTDLVQIPGVRLVPAGRLDADTEGLILLSNDGDFVFKVTHPSQSLGKTYLATVEGFPTKKAVLKLGRGLMLEGETRPTAPAGARFTGNGPEPHTSIIELTLHEGRNRQVRRMMERIGHPVKRLVRIRVGPVRLGELQPGQWRDLTRTEIQRIRAGGETANRVVDAEEEKSVKPGRRPIKSRPAGRPREEERAPMANQGKKVDRATSPVKPRRPEGERRNETGDRGRSRPGPGEDNRKFAEKRLQIHEDRVDGRVSARGERNAPDGRGGKRPGAVPRDNRRGEQNT